MSSVHQGTGPLTKTACHLALSGLIRVKESDKLGQSAQCQDLESRCVQADVGPSCEMFRAANVNKFVNS